ncbi:hypothetical protein HPP92_022713 [Vanilla planifolia]|uniref:ABC transmembrane type-1 domain-containing protein n=1 Tax=Vanilla planifolia TaxID=51239 RepID=A0A835PVW4_VANPL|nr:hypothetical protein HPP92_022713 [Vanilla planifolia]
MFKYDHVRVEVVNKNHLGRPLRDIKSFKGNLGGHIRDIDHMLTSKALDVIDIMHSLLNTSVNPFVLAEWEPILKGWIFSVVSVCCLSVAVPKAGKLPLIWSTVENKRIARDGLALAVLVCARSVANYLQQAFLWEAALGTAFRIRAYVFGQVLQRDIRFFEGNAGGHTGDIAHRLTSEASDVADMMHSVLNAMVSNTLQILLMVIQMVMISPRLVLVSAVGIPFVLIVIGYLGEKLRGISRQANLSAAKLSSYLNEVLPSITFVKASNAEINEKLKFQRLAHIDMMAHLRKKKMKAFVPQFLQVIYVGGLIVLCACSLYISNNSVDGARFFSFTMSLALLIDPIQGIGKAFNELKEGEPALDRLFELAQCDCKVTDKTNAIELCKVTGDIKFCGVTFRYADDMPYVLNGVDIHIKSGERVAFIGPSGEGKTTLVKLLLRFYDPLHGHILLDNQDIQDIAVRSLREHLVLLPQDIAQLLKT